MLIHGYEIDFIPVGTDSERSGDAIACRYFDASGNQEVIVVDGGTLESGQQLVDHITTHYKTNKVAHVVNTHPDQDHASGLSVILESMDVERLWMHQPWNHSSRIRDLFHDGRMTDDSLAQRIADALRAAKKLESIAQQKGIPISEPFQGLYIGPFRVLHPSIEKYEQLVPQFPGTPESKLDAATSKLAKAFKSMKEAVFTVVESLNVETLQNDAATSAANESSVVLLGILGDRRALLTSDAGVEALSLAADYAAAIGEHLPNAEFVQIPHHGSRNNVTPVILNRILGPKGQEHTRTAFVSAGGKSSTHPRRVVTNAFYRRGCRVVAAKGRACCHRYRAPARQGWNTAAHLPLYDTVEEP